MTVFWKLISDIKSIIFLFLLFFIYATSSNKIFEYMKLKNRFTKEGEKAVSSSVNVGWLQLISLQVSNCFNNAHNFLSMWS